MQESVTGPQDLKQLSPGQLADLAREGRELRIEPGGR
jgi:hypothetical protein